MCQYIKDQLSHAEKEHSRQRKNQAPRPEAAACPASSSNNKASMPGGREQSNEVADIAREVRYKEGDGRHPMERGFKDAAKTGFH